MGLLDRLDALDRRAGFRGPSPVPWRKRRPPYPVIAAGTLILLEAMSFIQLAMDGDSGAVALAFIPLIAAVFVGTVVLLYSQRRWGLWALIATQVPVVARVVYRSIDNPAHVTGLLYVAAVIGLLTVPPSSRRFYLGDWPRRS